MSLFLIVLDGRHGLFRREREEVRKTDVTAREQGKRTTTQPPPTSPHPTPIPTPTPCSKFRGFNPKSDYAASLRYLISGNKCLNHLESTTATGILVAGLRPGEQRVSVGAGRRWLSLSIKRVANPKASCATEAARSLLQLRGGQTGSSLENSQRHDFGICAITAEEKFVRKVQNSSEECLEFVYAHRAVAILVRLQVHQL